MFVVKHVGNPDLKFRSVHNYLFRAKYASYNTYSIKVASKATELQIGKLQI